MPCFLFVVIACTAHAVGSLRLVGGLCLFWCSPGACTGKCAWLTCGVGLLVMVALWQHGLGVGPVCIFSAGSPFTRFLSVACCSVLC